MVDNNFVINNMLCGKTALNLMLLSTFNQTKGHISPL
uniref:Uncharacterized protein n=1 Tax=Anguilla anguilla TaxID=7936 RepID=A0A0E9X9N6_ANGAN